MARKFGFFLMVGVLIGALTGFAIADYIADLPQSASAEGQMSAEPEFTAIGGVADYWPEDSLNNLAAEEPMPGETAFSAVGGVADYWPEDGFIHLSQERGPMETGALPEMSEGTSNDVPSVEIGGTLYRIGIDTP